MYLMHLSQPVLKIILLLSQSKSYSMNNLDNRFSSFKSSKSFPFSSSSFVSNQENFSSIKYNYFVKNNSNQVNNIWSNYDQTVQKSKKSFNFNTFKDTEPNLNDSRQTWLHAYSAAYQLNNSLDLNLLNNQSIYLNEKDVLNLENKHSNQPSVNRSYSSFILIFARILYALVCVIGLCGNTLVIYVVLRFSKMQTVTNMYLLNLALADEMFLVGLPFLIVTLTYEYWPFGWLMCKIYMTITSINQFTSSLLLTVMSADRYIAVCHPLSSNRYRTSFIAKITCLSVWTLSAYLMIPIFIYADAQENDNIVSCNIYWPELKGIDSQRAFTLYSFTLGFFIPLILILVFYFLVICKLRTISTKHKSREKKKTRKKVTYLVLTVITAYAACWLPYWIGQVYITFIPTDYYRHTEFSFTFLLLAGCLSYANSAVNPILYAFLSENFKKSFTKAFTCAANQEVNAQLNNENTIFPQQQTHFLTTKTTSSTLNEQSKAIKTNCINNKANCGQLQVDQNLYLNSTKQLHQTSSTNCCHKSNNEDNFHLQTCKTNCNLTLNTKTSITFLNEISNVESIDLLDENKLSSKKIQINSNLNSNLNSHIYDKIKFFKAKKIPNFVNKEEEEEDEQFSDELSDLEDNKTSCNLLSLPFKHKFKNQFTNRKTSFKKSNKCNLELKTRTQKKLDECKELKFNDQNVVLDQVMIEEHDLETKKTNHESKSV